MHEFQFFTIITYYINIFHVCCEYLESSEGRSPATCPLATTGAFRAYRDWTLTIKLIIYVQKSLIISSPSLSNIHKSILNSFNIENMFYFFTSTIFLFFYFVILAIRITILTKNSMSYYYVSNYTKEKRNIRNSYRNPPLGLTEYFVLIEI